MQVRPMLVLGLLVVGCGQRSSTQYPTSDSPCADVRTLPSSRSGYEILWTCLADMKLLSTVCPASGNAGIVLETAVLRGTGPLRLGSTLQTRLQPFVSRLPTFEGWARGCEGFGIILRGTSDVDRAIEMIGSVLLRQKAGDRVIIFRALAGAPAA